LWCSEACRELSSPVNHTAAFDAFLQISEDSGVDYMPLAGALVDMVIDAVRRGSTVPKAMEPLDMLVGVPYWEAVVTSEGSDTSHKAKHKAALEAKQAVEKSVQALKAAYEGDQVVQKSPELQHRLLSVEGFGLVVGLP